MAYLFLFKNEGKEGFNVKSRFSCVLQIFHEEFKKRQEKDYKGEC
jgi:hypothetical protein